MNLTIQNKVARAMRDAIMERPTSDDNWAACGGHYLRNLQTFERSLAELGLEITAKVTFTIGLAGQIPAGAPLRCPMKDCVLMAGHAGNHWNRLTHWE